MRVIYKKRESNQEEESYYELLVCKSLERLDVFKSWYVWKSDVYGTPSVIMHDIPLDDYESFIRMGMIQNEIRSMAHFQIDNRLCLRLVNDHTWEQVYDKLNLIEMISTLVHT